MSYEIAKTHSNELNTPRVTGCWPQTPPPHFPDPPSVKKDPTEKVHKPGLNRVKEYLRVCDFRHHKFMFFIAFDYKTCFSGTRVSVFVRLGNKTLGLTFGLILSVNLVNLINLISFFMVALTMW